MSRNQKATCQTGAFLLTLPLLSYLILLSVPTPTLTLMVLDQVEQEVNEKERKRTKHLIFLLPQVVSPKEIPAGMKRCFNLNELQRFGHYSGQNVLKVCNFKEMSESNDACSLQQWRI